MPPKKSMKSINTQSDNQDISKSKNIFDALILDDNDNSEKISNNNVEINTPMLPDIKINNEILHNDVIIPDDTSKDNSKDNSKDTSKDNSKDTSKDNSKDNTMLNIPNNINISDFISDNNKNKHKHQSNNKYRDVKYDEKMIDHKQIYDENVDYGDIGNELKLNSHWTVWIHRPNGRGILVRFSDKGEAYSYSISILRNDSDDAHIHITLEQIHLSTSVYGVGQTDCIQVAMFSGIKVPSSVLNFNRDGFYLMNPTHALKLGLESLIDYKNETAPIVEVPLTVENLDHWTECLSEKARSYLP